MAVGLSGFGGNNTLGPALGTTNTSGIYTTTLTSTSAPSETVTASFGAGLGVTTDAQFTPEPASSATSNLTVSPNT